MKEELEICVRCFDKYDEIINKLSKYNFNIKEDFQLNDIYMIKSDIDINDTDDYIILSDYILIRETVGKKKYLSHKYKEYKDKEIVSQSKSECLIEDIDDAKVFLESIGYRELLKIYDHNILVSNGENELYIQILSDDEIYIEMESKNIYSNNSNGSNVDELISNVNKFNLSLGDFYFENKSINCLKKIKSVDK